MNYLSSEYDVANITIYKWIKELYNVQVSNTEAMSVKEYQKIKRAYAKS